MKTEIERMVEYCDNFDRSHIFDCPHCDQETNKLESQKSCQHCSGGLQHSLTFYGYYVTKKAK